jgi:hypothetical protein
VAAISPIISGRESDTDGQIEPGETVLYEDSRTTSTHGASAGSRAFQETHPLCKKFLGMLADLVCPSPRSIRFLWVLA